MDNQQRHTVWLRELCSMSSGSLAERGFWERMDTCLCMTEFLCCPPETITTLLMDYTPIQNKKFKNKKVRNIVHLTAGQYLWQVFLLNNFFGQEETFRFDLSYSTNFIKTINNTALLDEAYICIIKT